MNTSRLSASRFTLFRVVSHGQIPRLRRSRRFQQRVRLPAAPPEKAQAGELISSLGVSPSTCASTIGIPLDELADQLAELPDDQDIVAYCRGAYCVLAHEAVRLLTDHGRSAVRLADGMLEWRLADLPFAT